MFPLNVASATVGDKLNLTTQTFDSIDSPPGGQDMVSGVRVGSDGQLYEVDGWTTLEQFTPRNAPTDWIDPKNNMANYEAFATTTNIGDDWDLSSAYSTWINCSLQPQWGVQRGNPAGTNSAVIAVQIRAVSTSLVKAAVDYTCNAQVI